MDTRWKSKIGIIAWLVLFVYGVSGVLTALINENDYMKKSYFNTSQFQHTIEEFSQYIYAFDISYQSIEEMKNAISVSKSEIEEYRSWDTGQVHCPVNECILIEGYKLVFDI